MIKQWLRNWLGIQELSDSIETLKKRSSFIDRLKKEIMRRNRAAKEVQNTNEEELPDPVVKGYNGPKSGL